MNKPNVTPQDLLPAVLTSAVQDTSDGWGPLVAVVGRLMLPDVPFASRQTLLPATCIYLRCLAMPSSWTVQPQLSDEHDAVVWTNPRDEVVVDVPRLACRNDRLLDDATSRRVRDLVETDWGVHELTVVRILALAAPLASIGQQPKLPLRPFRLVTSRFAFGLDETNVPAPRKEDS